MKKIVTLAVCSLLSISSAVVHGANAYNRSIDTRKDFIKELRDIRLASNKEISSYFSHGVRRRLVNLIAGFFDARNKLVETEQALLDLKDEDYSENFLAIEETIHHKLDEYKEVVRQGIASLEEHERVFLQSQCQKVFTFIKEETSGQEDEQELFLECPRRRKRDIAKRSFYTLVGGSIGIVAGLVGGYLYAGKTTSGGSNPVAASAGTYIFLIKTALGGVLGGATGWAGTLGLFVVKDYVHADLDVLALLAIGSPDELF